MDNGNDAKREPLLSDKAIGKAEDYYWEVDVSDGASVRTKYFPNGPTYFSSGADWARDFYEPKITKGELIVAKTVKNVEGRCSGCEQMLTEDHNGCSYTADWEFCPGCGAKIIEA